jgi:hypothetical protein
MLYAHVGALNDAYALADQCLDSRAAAAAIGGQLTGGSFFAPEARAFRRDSRFQAFATRYGLMDYWQQYGPPDDCDLKNGKLSCH